MEWIGLKKQFSFLEVRLMFFREEMMTDSQIWNTSLFFFYEKSPFELLSLLFVFFSNLLRVLYIRQTF